MNIVKNVPRIINNDVGDRILKASDGKGKDRNYVEPE